MTCVLNGKSEISHGLSKHVLAWESVQAGAHILAPLRGSLTLIAVTTFRLCPHRMPLLSHFLSRKTVHLAPTPVLYAPLHNMPTYIQPARTFSWHILVT